MGNRICTKDLNSPEKLLKTNLIIATTNQGKIKEFQELFLPFPLNIIPQPRNLYIEETGNTFAENARIKAITSARVTGQMAFADDSGLSVDSLGGAPGIHSARYAENDSKRILKLLKELEGLQDRSAHFSAALCLVSSDQKVLLEVEGRCEGLITSTPRGANGFGYDPIFEVKGTGLTFGEMEVKQKKLLGHRGKAFSKLIPALENIFFI